MRGEDIARLFRDLGKAGPRFSLSTEARFEEVRLSGMWLCADGQPRMQLDFWEDGLHGAEALANLLDQVQDVVAETLTEMWPLCPLHDHMLVATPAGDHVEWRCSETGTAIARFGELTAV